MCIAKVNPALSGLADSPVSTMKALFAATGVTHDTHRTFFGCPAVSVGAGISTGRKKIFPKKRRSHRPRPQLRGE